MTKRIDECNIASILPLNCFIDGPIVAQLGPFVIRFYFDFFKLARQNILQFLYMYDMSRIILDQK